MHMIRQNHPGIDGHGVVLRRLFDGLTQTVHLIHQMHAAPSGKGDVKKTVAPVTLGLR